MGQAHRPRPDRLHRGRLRGHGIDLRRPRPRGPRHGRVATGEGGPGNRRPRAASVIIPIFAIERAQELIYYLNRLLAAGRIPAGARVSRQPDGGRRERGLPPTTASASTPRRGQMVAAGQSLLKFPVAEGRAHAWRSRWPSTTCKGPAIIMSTSGMCTAGRIKHHLAHHIGEPAVHHPLRRLPVAGARLGRQILDGNREVRIHGRSRLVRARVAQIQGISGHADRDGLAEVAGPFPSPAPPTVHHPRRRRSFLILGQTGPRDLGWNVTVPEYKQTVELD